MSRDYRNRRITPSSARSRSGAVPAAGVLTLYTPPSRGGIDGRSVGWLPREQGRRPGPRVLSHHHARLGGSVHRRTATSPSRQARGLRGTYAPPNVPRGGGQVGSARYGGVPCGSCSPPPSSPRARCRPGDAARAPRRRLGVSRQGAQDRRLSPRPGDRHPQPEHDLRERPRQAPRPRRRAPWGGQP